MTAIDQLLTQPGAWFVPGGDVGIVVSSRVRLARNLQRSAFPGWAGAQECERIWNMVRPILSGLKTLQPCFDVGMNELNELDKQILFERHLISREEAEREAGSGLVASMDERLAVMVNEEDHFRMQSMRPGLDLKGAWKVLNALDDELDGQVTYAFSPRLGYLTACPTNLGTGMRASVMVHVPGLVLMNEINPVVKALNKIGLAVRGLWGEGTEAVGNMFQISNQMTLGEREDDTVAVIEQIAHEVVDHERNARLRLLEKKENTVRDHVGRAFGILHHAYVLNSRETLDMLSALRLGIDLGILKINQRLVDELLVLSQPAHLQKLEGRKLKPKDRDRVRAERVRKRLIEAETAPDTTA